MLILNTILLFCSRFYQDENKKKMLCEAILVLTTEEWLYKSVIKIHCHSDFFQEEKTCMVMMGTIKWGVIGCGGIAARRTIPEWLKADLAVARLISVMDPSAERAEEIAQRHGVSHWSSSVEELLAQDLDAVYIATPPYLHCAHVLQSAEAGKHILCEKPIAATLAEVEQMEIACQRAGVKFMLGFCMRNNVYNKKAKELVHRGAIGQIIMGRAQLTCWYPPIPGAWRQDIQLGCGGSLIDMGTHCLDLLEWIMDSRINEVCGFQSQLTHAYATPIEDASTIVLHFENGAHGIVDNYFNLPDAAAQNTLEMHGTKGSILGQGTIGQDPTGRLVSICQQEETGYSADQVRTESARKKQYRLKGLGIYGQMIEVFSRCILEDKEPPISLADGRHSVKVVNAIYEATRERRTVTIE
jgi:predicted dehydrogenase